MKTIKEEMLEKDKRWLEELNLLAKEVKKYKSVDEFIEAMEKISIKSSLGCELKRIIDRGKPLKETLKNFYYERR